MKYCRSVVVLFSVFCLTTAAVGQWLQPQPFRKRAVYGSDYYVSPSSYNFADTARSIVGNAATRYDKGQCIYLWLCQKISFDRSGRIRTADAAWQSRKAVCQGYCELFYRLGETVGLHPRLVYGKCRLPSRGDENEKLQDHVWIILPTEHGDILLDPTWGAGYYRGDKFIRQPDPLCWYDVDPAWYVFTHLPKRKSHQHLSPAISSSQFARLPFVTPPSKTDSFDVLPREVLDQALMGDYTRVPKRRMSHRIDTLNFHQP